MKPRWNFLIMASMIVIASCSNEPAAPSETSSADTSATASPELTTVNASVKEDSVSYKDGSVTLKGYVAFNSEDTAKHPAILVVPEWWGVNDYVRKRAKQLASLGYVAMTVDMYGDGKIAANPDEAMSYAGPFYSNPGALKSRFEAAYKKLKSNPRVDTSKISAVGYCFGGYVALNAAKMGANLLDVVSFHGGLGGVPPQKDLFKANLLICHGEADDMVPVVEVAQFKKSMDSIGHAYTFKSYPGATHAFTNPEATELGKKFNMTVAYNGPADTASWNDMKAFFATTRNK